MKMQEIMAMAKELGVMTKNMKKTELVKAIQRAEGNADCFRAMDPQKCNQTDCLWRQDCLSMN